jgi:hypothetical protein
MTGEDLRTILLSTEFQQQLGEISSYLASVKQEAPIIYSVAKQLWKRGVKYQLEADRQDLFVGNKRFEFKVYYDCDMERLRDQLKRNSDKSLHETWHDIRARKVSTGWNVMLKIYDDICVKKADVFVMVICSRDLSKLDDADRNRVCWSKEQCKYNKRNPFNTNRDFLATADSYLDGFKMLRGEFSMLKEELKTNGDFPSIYHFRICEFSKTT